MYNPQTSIQAGRAPGKASKEQDVFAEERIGNEQIRELLRTIGLRTSQDLSYAALGLASVYYLTRDAQVLADLIRLKQHIFNTYRDKKTGLIKWVAKDDGSGDATAMVAAGTVTDFSLEKKSSC